MKDNLIHYMVLNEQFLQYKSLRDLQIDSCNFLTVPQILHYSWHCILIVAKVCKMGMVIRYKIQSHQKMLYIPFHQECHSHMIGHGISFHRHNARNNLTI